MKKIVFSQHVLPHLIAVIVFLVVTVFFFKPVFFDHQKLTQRDIQEWEGSSKELRDFRKETGEEGLWSQSMFSGMPAYLINVEWGNHAIRFMKQVLTVYLPHPINNIFAAFICYYILLLTFGVRPYLAIAGAISFGLSSYMLIGLSAGHNARVGAVAFMPMVMAGIHLVFSNRRILGFGVTAAAFALHLRENHLQITYYLAMIVAIYGIVQLVRYIRARQIGDWAKNVGILIPAVALAIASFIGPLWGVTEYSAYSIRGKSELENPGAIAETGRGSGLGKTYAFEFSNGLLEPMTLLIPNFYGGGSMNYLFQDKESDTYKALVNAQDNQMANQLAGYSSAYWGPQRLSAPYYAGAIVVFLFVVGIAFNEKHWAWWLITAAVLGVFLSWGKTFEAFNYTLFDYLPGYNKFRSVTFAIIITLFALPLFGFMGLERLMREGLTKENKKKLFIAFGVTAGLCLISMVLSGMLSYTRDVELQLPAWFTNALAGDRRSLLISDAIRSFAFISAAFILIYFSVFKKSPVGFAAFLIFMVMIDHAVVDKRFIKEENYARRSISNSGPGPSEADQVILRDKGHYRVYNLQNSLSDAWNEANTSYFHHSIGGYHGAKMKRYQDLLDSCLYNETAEFVTDIQARNLHLENYGILNMLNVKYIKLGEAANAVLTNTEANGNAWFVQDLVPVNSANDELKALCTLDTKRSAVVDASKFKLATKPAADTTSTIELKKYKPNTLTYESNSTSSGFVVFSEIYYEKGWKAFIDGKEVPILRANYILRALAVPAGKHTIEFNFQPNAYTTGNKVTTVSSWLVLLLVAGCIGFSLKKEEPFAV
jgi:hypothetical protein